jgi:cysteine-rich repeat protein
MRPVPPSLGRLARLFALAVALGVAPAAAQIADTPPFQVAPGPGFAETPFDALVGAAGDGSLLALWRAAPASTQRNRVWQLDQTGMSLAPVVPLDALDNAFPQDVVPDGTGGHLTAFTSVQGALRVLRHAPDGTPLGTYDVQPDGTYVIVARAALLPAGPVYAWWSDLRVWARPYDLAGVPLTAPIEVGPIGTPPYVVTGSVRVAALADGGFVVVWSAYDNVSIYIRYRVFDADGTPRTPIVTLGGPVWASEVAGRPGGGFTIAGFLYTGGSEVHAWHYDAAGTGVGETVLAVLPAGVVALVDLAYDASGYGLVAWSELSQSGFGQVLRTRGRGLAPSGAAVGPAFDVAGSGTQPLRTVLALSGGRYLTAWTDTGLQASFASIWRVCTAAESVCGDGTLVGICEECDDGAANSDTTPDACRTDCTLPLCGDGVADVGHGETCDDGNDDRCDGCTPDCQVEVGLVCGDGASTPGCGEACDDGNLVAGDGCDQCTLERVPGGGSKSNDCLIEWIVNNPTNEPLLDARGDFSTNQRCVDDDPRCDLDGGIPGSCTFGIAVCANNTDIPDCQRSFRLQSWELLKPSASQAAKRPALAAIRAAFLTTVPGAVVGPSEANVCSAFALVPVTLKGEPGAFGPGKIVIKARTSDYDGRKDVDTLKLRCDVGP